MRSEKLAIPSARDGWVMYYERSVFGEGTLHLHRELELNLVIRGRGEYLIAGGRYSIASGSLLWLFPSQAHLLVEASDDFAMWVAVFRPRFVKRLAGGRTELVAALESESLDRVYGGRLDGLRYQELAVGLQRLSQLGNADDAWFNSGLGYYLNLGWEAVCGVTQIRAASRVHPAVEKALHYLREQCGQEPLPMMARKLGISYSRLCGLFSEQTGESLTSYRNRMRIERLMRLFRIHPDRTLLELSLEAGFGSYAQCHRIVSSLTGLSPRHLRSGIEH
jgi:AraC-like DNA-binding protein